MENRAQDLSGRGEDVAADVVSESGHPVDELGILQDVECVGCSLPGNAVVCAQAGDRGRWLAGGELARGDADTQQRGDADVRPRIRLVPAWVGVCARA